MISKTFSHLTILAINYLINHNTNFLKDKKSIYGWKDGTGVDLEASKFDLIVFDEMQNCYFYDRFYEFMDLILKKGLTSGKYCFLGDFKYQNLVSDEITIFMIAHRVTTLKSCNRIFKMENGNIHEVDPNILT